MTGFVTGLREQLVAAAARERGRRLPRLGPVAPGTLVAAAAVAVLVALVALAATGGLRGERRAPMPPVNAGIMGRALFHGPLEEGVRYRTRVLVPTVSFVAPDGRWRMLAPPEVDRVLLERREPGGLIAIRRLSEVFDPAVRSLRRSRVPAPFDYHRWLRAHPDLRVGPSREMSVAGVAATAFDVAVEFSRAAHPDNRCGVPCTAIAPGESYPDGTRMRTVVLWTSPGPVVINQIGRTAADRDQVVAAAAPLLDSLGIGID